MYMLFDNDVVVMLFCMNDRQRARRSQQSPSGPSLAPTGPMDAAIIICDHVNVVDVAS